MKKTDHKLYQLWKNIKGRCYVKSNASYKRYGARGITVEERWHDFWNFVEDVDNYLENGHLLYQKGFVLDKDKKGGKIYSLENCVVMTEKENRELANEKVKRPIIAFNGTEELRFDSITEASEVLRIKRGNIQSSLKSEYQFKYAEK